MLQQDFDDSAHRYIHLAAQGGIDLKLTDFELVGDEITIDGMSAGDWIDDICEAC